MNPLLRASLLSVPLVALLLTGCRSTPSEPIVFSDEKSVQTQVNAPIVTQPKARKLSRADDTAVQRQVLIYLLGRHFWDNADYTAVFLQTRDPLADALRKEFPQHVPPIKPSYRANLMDNRTPTDLDTGKDGMVLSVEVGEPNADDSVDAIGRWYGGPAVTGFYTFHLHKTGEDWQIDRVN
jgi:hypothetical protein